MFGKSHHLLHHIFHNHSWNPEILEYYIFKIMKTISLSLLAFFVPVFLYADVGYSLFEIMLFFTINQLIFILLTPFSGYVIKYLGIKRTMAISLPGMGLFIYLLRFLKGDFWGEFLLILLFLFIRVVPKFPEITAETIFISKNILHSSSKEGSSLAWIKITLLLGALLAPLVGGIIIFFFGFELFFNVTIGLLFLSILPLLMTKDEYFSLEENPEVIWKFTFSSISKDFSIAELGRYFSDSIMWLLWPLFLFLITNNAKDLGIIVSVAGVLSMVISYGIGKKINKKTPKNMLKRMTKIATGLFFFRVLFPTPTLLVITDAINKIIDPLLMIPYEKYRFDYIKSFKNLVETSISINIILQISYGLGFLALALIFGALELFAIEASLWVFWVLFLAFGTGLLLMARMQKTAPY